MAQHKAEIRFADDVWKKIEWFTYNFKTEIGALGKMKTKKDPETGEKYFYVYKLLFPQQQVTGATVHFTADMWGELLREHKLEGLSDVGFYWHRHPGSSAHSGTDDVDTFETFMSKEANRKYFAFLQTAVNSNGVWNEEARIDIRLPVRHTILNADIKISVEENAEDEALRIECEAIAKKCIVVPVVPDKPKNTTQYGAYNNYRKTTYGFDWNTLNLKLDIGNYVNLNTAINEGRFGFITGINEFDNDFVGEQVTCVDEKLAISFANGQVTVTTGKIYEEVLLKELSNESSSLKECVRSFKKWAGKIDGLNVFSLQPKKKMYTDLRLLLTKSYLIYNNELIHHIAKELTPKAKEDSVLEKSVYEAINLKETTITGKADVVDTLEALDNYCLVDWENKCSGTVYDLNKGGIIGNVYITNNKDKLYIKGQQIMNILTDSTVEEDLSGEMINIMLDDSEEEN